MLQESTILCQRDGFPDTDANQYISRNTTSCATRFTKHHVDRIMRCFAESLGMPQRRRLRKHCIAHQVLQRVRSQEASHRARRTLQQARNKQLLRDIRSKVAGGHAWARPRCYKPRVGEIDWEDCAAAASAPILFLVEVTLYRSS